VFVRLLLPLAVKHRVPREDMVKRLFVFSDMQVDQATGTWEDVEGWETNHDAIARAYAGAGYDVPEIVYWNLASRLETVPVEAERKGVALMNGFSPAMMKVFMGEDADGEEKTMDDDMVMVDEQGEGIKPTPQKQEMMPLSLMKKALGMASYDKLVVLDRETLHATYNRICTTCSNVFILQMRLFSRQYSCVEHEPESEQSSVLYF